MYILNIKYIPTSLLGGKAATEKAFATASATVDDTSDSCTGGGTAGGAATTGGSGSKGGCSLGAPSIVKKRFLSYLLELDVCKIC